MTTRSSSSSSSDSETEEITQGVRGGTAGNLQTTGSIYRAASSTASQNSAVPTGTPYDTVSIATTNTGFTSATNFTGNTSVSQQATLGGGIPIIRPPVLQSQENLASAVNQPIRVDVASAQQRTVQPQISPYSNSSVTSSSASLSSPGSAYLQQQQQQQQPRFDAAKAMFQQVDANRDGSISREEFRQWAQGGQRAQSANQYSGHQQFNQLLGTASYNDSGLHIDYGAIEAYNFGLQSAGDITAEQFTKGFDAAKAIFRQVDANRDGSISRDEFRQWAQGGQQNFSGQTYPNYDNNYQQTQSYGNTNPDIASVLQQSGLAQGYANYR